MLPALYDDQRAALMRFSLMLCCGSIALMPFLTGYSAAASAASVVPPNKWSAVMIPAQSTERGLQILRDPFVAEVATVAPPAANQPEAFDAIDVVLPPNSGALQTPLGSEQGAVVRAVALGEASRALVDVGGSVRVVGIGDSLGGSTISRIDAAGVVLANGERIGLAEARP